VDFVEKWGCIPCCYEKGGLGFCSFICDLSLSAHRSLCLVSWFIGSLCEHLLYLVFLKFFRIDCEGFVKGWDTPEVSPLI